jgi:hypothetical protein
MSCKGTDMGCMEQEQEAKEQGSSKQPNPYMSL